MSAVIRAYGEDLDVDAFLVDCSLPICAVIRRGVLVFPKTQAFSRRHEHSGIHVSVSDAEFNEFSKQIADAVRFLGNQEKQIRRLCGWPGVETVTIDFGIERRDVAVQCDYLPPELVRLAGSLGLGIELSHYPICLVTSNGSS